MRLTLPTTAEFTALRNAAKKLFSAGFPTRLVGGAVRDLVLGRTPSDLDLVTTAPHLKVVELFPGSRVVGQSFGVVLLQTGDFQFETATAREERTYLDGRHPEAVKTTTDFRVDSERRDFTINAMSCDPVTGELFDYHGGVDDLRRGIIRTVGDPERRFTEDYLRMLRAIRFAARYDFELASETLAAIEKNAALAAKIASERVREELTQMLTSRFPDKALLLLEKSRLLSFVLPEVSRLRQVEQPPQFHPEGDVLTHTALMLRHMALATPLLAWSVLLHDVGKFTTARRDETGRIRFFGHESEGARLAVEMMTRLHFSRNEIKVVETAIQNHMRFASVEAMKEGKLRQIVADENFALELELNRLDCLASNHLFGALIRCLDFLGTLPDVELPPPLITGRDLIAAGLTPSPRFKELLDQLFDWQIAQKIDDRETMLAKMAEWIEVPRG